ncbi:uncharacterized protein LOC114763047 [Neltuma alba]|uniref:uncharacterized protein LOC114763047 n=1 Tax=Neltuma alba TaxID=207710 RepID=UPI0010A577E5|nr:uncharacterized protein LOC114763047 [Prosopis alba]
MRVCVCGFRQQVRMTTLVRNGTLTFSRRYRYEPLGLKSVSYRRRRAKQRQIFLTTYRLSSFSQDFPDSKPPSSSSSSPPKLKKVAVKVKKMVNSVLVFMRTGSFRSCSSKSAISASSPAPSSNTKTFYWP